MKSLSAALSLSLSFLLLLSSCSKAPSDPKSFGEKVLQTFIDDDYDAFIEMTVVKLSKSQLESTFENLMERKLAYMEEKIKEIDDNEEKEDLQKRIKTVKENLEGDLEALASRIYLKNTLDELEFEDWKEMVQEVQKYDIEQQEKRILELERQGPKSSLEYAKEYLKELKEPSWDTEDFKGRNSDRGYREKNWEESFDNIIKAGKKAGINWEDVKFEFVDYDKEKLESVDDVDITLVLSYRAENFRIKLDDCLETNLGILMLDQPSWRGAFDEK